MSFGYNRSSLLTFIYVYEQIYIQICCIFSPKECFEHDVDYVGNVLNNQYGNDYGKGGGKRYSALECQHLCEKTQGCAGFTYQSAGKYALKECWLKSKGYKKEIQSGAISGTISSSYCEGIFDSIFLN